MIRSNLFVKAIHLTVSTLLLAIGLRAWMVMGLVAPVTVSGSSMVPALSGEFVTAECPRCKKAFDVGGEFAARSSFAACPRCTEPLVPLTALPFQAADRLWIDRTTFQWRAPRRWEVAVSCCPDDAAELCVKRVIGLPGESVRLSHGDIFIDGKILRKSLAAQLMMRQIVYLAEGVRPRWQRVDNGAWQWLDGRWQCQASEAGGEHWLRYVHSQGQPVTDDSSYNASVSRPLNLVQDFMLSGELRMTGNGTLALEFDDGRQICRVIVQPAERAVRFEVAGKRLISGRLSDLSCDRLMAGKAVGLLFSNFDQQLLLALDGRVELQSPLSEEHLPPVGTAEPVAIGAWGGGVSLQGLSLYRDVFYQPSGKDVVYLEGEEYYLLGDNAPISVDSRQWGPVPGRLLVGKPLGAR